MSITFPVKKPKVIVETRMMTQIINRTLAVHPLSALVVWYGESRIGKTTTAEFMVTQILEAYDDNNPHAFKAKYLEVGQIARWSGNEMKQGVKSLHFAVLGDSLDEGVYQTNPIEAVAARIVHELKRRNIQLIFIDEAGGLSLDAIQGMVLVRDTALSMGWTLTIVFIGMDDLPIKIDRKQQIAGRVNEWCYFVEYALDDTWNLLAKLHPHFAALDRKNQEHVEQVQFLRETYGGIPGHLMPFVQRMDYRLKEHCGEIDLRFLRGVHLLTARDKQRSIEHSLTTFKGVPRKKAQEQAAFKAKPRQEERIMSNGNGEHRKTRHGRSKA
jgi:hypothetical protein